MSDKKNPKPTHVGIILDGNRRFARRLMKEPWKGHEYGAEKAKQLLRWSADLGIKKLTLYTFSMQNFNRPKMEFDYLMKIFRETFEKVKEDKTIHEKKIRVRFIGRTHLFPADVNKAMQELEQATEDYSDYQVTFAMAYGGREEIIDAVKKIGRKIEAGELTDEQITEELIDANVYMADKPDFIIRTGGDHRTSNFLVWQSSYSEWFFLEKTWPEFEEQDLIDCVEQYMNRERRFGK